MNGLADTIRGTCTPEGVPNTPPISGDITHKKTALMAVCATKRGRPSPYTVFFRCKVRIATFVCRCQEIENSFMKYIVEELDEIGQTSTHRLAANKGKVSIIGKPEIHHFVPPTPRRLLNAVIHASNTCLIFSKFARPGLAIMLATVSNGSGVFQMVAFPS